VTYVRLLTSFAAAGDELAQIRRVRNILYGGTAPFDLSMTAWPRPIHSGPMRTLGSLLATVV